jgi:hypothetical protein
MDMPASFAHQRYMLSYLKKKAKRMAETVPGLAKPLHEWALSDILRKILAVSKVEADIGYAHPTGMENVLARFLFGPLSKFRQPIDVLVKKVESIPPEDFAQHVVRICFDLMPRDGYSPVEQSTVLLVLLWTIFNRCYELNSSFFVHRIDQALLTKLSFLSRVPAGRLPLPWQLLNGGEPTETASALFSRFPFFLSAVQFFSSAFFEPNPMDALFHIHKCLVSIQKAALIHGSPGDVLEHNELHRMLSFDDLFALFFGIMLASEFPDVFYLARLIGDFAPKPLLSASFEYASATLEALITHCRQISVAEICGDGN